MRTKVILFTILSLSIFVFNNLLAQAPRLINYQGVLKQNGTPANGNFVVLFRIYDSATSSTELFSETHPNLRVSNGAFNVLLGSVDTLPDSVFSTEGPRFLGITVAGDSEMTPRFEFTSVSYAQRAAVADAVSSGGEKVRIVHGQIDSEGNVLSGSGFTAVKTSLGKIQLIFTTPFVENPTAIVLACSPEAVMVVIEESKPSFVKFISYSHGGAFKDGSCGWSFLVIGKTE